MRRLFAVVLAVLMLFAGCSSHSGAQTPEVTEEPYVIRDLPETQSISIAESFAGGSGTETDPYQISNENQLALMAQKVAEDVTYASASYVLTGNISLNDTAAFAQWETEIPKNSWEPIGRTGNDFLGVFDGQGHTISGLYINTDSELTESYNDRNYGLFGTVAGVVKNLTVTESWIHVTGKSATGAYVGGVAGNVTDKGSIENCVSGVMVFECDANCGGITGGISGGLVIGKDYGENEKPTYAQVKDCGFEGTIIRKNPCNVSYMGGIAGSGDGVILDCVNRGTLQFSGDTVDSVGGIVGFIGDGIVANCENAGTLQCSVTGESTVAARVGGIVGNLFLSNVGSEDYMSRGVTVESCKNTGSVSGQMYTGGIVGSASNDHNDWCLTVLNCENSGVVNGVDYTGGIIGRLSCVGDADHGDNVRIENCRNTVDLRNGTVGGIVGQFMSETGSAVIRGCENSGNLTGTSQNCGGIIGYWSMGSKPDVQVLVEECTNSGSIETQLNAGGIVSYADAAVLLELSDETAVTIRNCQNTGNLVTNGENGYVGGIAGNLGFATIDTLIENCTNLGNIHMNNQAPDEETLNSKKIFTISRICGGIVGRIGPGLLLTTDSDEADPGNLNGEDSWIRLVDCGSAGAITANDEKEYTNPDGEELYTNYFGGIVGNWCGEKEFSLTVQDCVYANAERGLGDDQMPDVGKSVSADQIG